jgi:hypothetical protein
VFMTILAGCRYRFVALGCSGNLLPVMPGSHKVGCETGWFYDRRAVIA